MKFSGCLIVIALFFSNVVQAQKKFTVKEAGQYTIVTNEGGQTLGYSPKSGVTILVVDGFAFKDLNKNGKLDKYEDWRLSTDERAIDRASKMTFKKFAGLMLYSRPQPIPAPPAGPFTGTYNGKPFAE